MTKSNVVWQMNYGVMPHDIKTDMNFNLVI